MVCAVSHSPDRQMTTDCRGGGLLEIDEVDPLGGRRWQDGFQADQSPEIRPESRENAKEANTAGIKATPQTELGFDI